MRKALTCIINFLCPTLAGLCTIASQQHSCAFRSVFMVYDIILTSYLQPVGFYYEQVCTSTPGLRCKAYLFASVGPKGHICLGFAACHTLSAPSHWQPEQVHQHILTLHETLVLQSREGNRQFQRRASFCGAFVK